jgi:hypothetical protein
MAEYAPRASESGHFYTRDGIPVYEVPRADGKGTCEPDVRHARKLQLVPGVTSITRCAAAPGLVQWQVYQGILAALTLPRRPHEPEPEYLRRVYDDSRQQAEKAAEEGTRIHAAIEQDFSGGEYDSKYLPHVEGAVAQIQKLWPTAKWETEKAFAHPLGFGSKIDLFGNGGAIIVDTKSKDMSEDDVPTKENKKRLHYDEMAMQLAAYRHALGTPDTVCANLFVSRTVPGLAHVHVWEREDLERGWQMFKALLAFWQARQKYQSGWTP